MAKPQVKQISYRGKLSLSNLGRALTIVGSRKMTFYGRQAIAKLIPGLVEAGITLISGFMYGVDQEVHRLCLECGGKTVAVLGWGIDWVVPDSDQSLYQLIEREGLFMSEYRGDIKPQLWMFPSRDRVMAALGEGTLVIEAAVRSGSLITANYAGIFGRKALAVPGPITSNVSRGTNLLIQSGQGKMVTSTEDILRIMGWDYRPRESVGGLGKFEVLTSFLENEPLTIDELCRKTKKPVAEITAELTRLQLEGKVNSDNGKFYINHAH